MIYKLEDRVPPGTALLISIQQVGAMLIGTITPPLILGGILHFKPEETAYFVSMALLCSALGTLLQTTRPGFVGSGLLSVTGTSFAFLPILILCIQQGGFPLAFGMALAAAPTVLILAPLLPWLRTVFTPLVSGLVVLLIGISLIPTGMRNITLPAAEGAPAWGGFAAAAIVLTVIVISQLMGKNWARIGGLLLGVAAGYAFYAAFGWLRVPPETSSFFTLPRPVPFGLDFRWELLLPFAFLYVVTVLESMGDMTATAHLSGLTTTGRDHWLRMRGGILADGLTCVAAAVAGSFPSTTYAQNNGVIQITGVASRRIGPLMALMLAVLGLFPPVSRWITAMPAAVLGALAILLFGMVAVAGLRLIMQSGLNQRDALIAALTLAVGIGFPAQEEWLAMLPPGLKALLESGVTCGGLTALALNFILPRVKRDHPDSTVPPS